MSPAISPRSVTAIEAPSGAGAALRTPHNVATANDRPSRCQPAAAAKTSRMQAPLGRLPGGARVEIDHRTVIRGFYLDALQTRVVAEFAQRVSDCERGEPRPRVRTEVHRVPGTGAVDGDDHVAFGGFRQRALAALERLTPYEWLVGEEYAQHGRRIG